MFDNGDEMFTKTQHCAWFNESDVPDSKKHFTSHLEV